MSSDDDKPPLGLSDNELDLAGGWLFESCYKYEMTSEHDALCRDAANLASAPGSGKL